MRLILGIIIEQEMYIRAKKMNSYVLICVLIIE